MIRDDDYIKIYTKNYKIDDTEEDATDEDEVKDDKNDEQTDGTEEDNGPVDELSKTFKGFGGIVFLLGVQDRLIWGSDTKTGLPYRKIMFGTHGLSKPLETYSPYEIKYIKCTPPFFSHYGKFVAYDMEDCPILELENRHNENCAHVEKFNHYLELYRRYKLPM